MYLVHAAQAKQYLGGGGGGLFCGRNPQIHRVSGGADWTGGRRREAVNILTLTIQHVCNLDIWKIQKKNLS